MEMTFEEPEPVPAGVVDAGSFDEEDERRVSGSSGISSGLRLENVSWKCWLLVAARVALCCAVGWLCCCMAGMQVQLSPKAGGLCMHLPIYPIYATCPRRCRLHVLMFLCAA